MANFDGNGNGGEEVMEKIYLVWGQYGDKSGHIFIRAFRDKGPAEALKETLDAVNPSYKIMIDEVLYDHNN